MLVQRVYDFRIRLKEYFQKGVGNDFPMIDICPGCDSRVRLNRHGFYWRNAVLLKRDYRIPILRLICPCCCKTISILPDFLLPYFQRPVKLTIAFLKQYFACKRVLSYYQQLQFYRRRFLKNLVRIEAFFRDMGCREKIPAEEKQKAIKLLDMISAFPKAETFARRFNGHFQKAFMAK